MRIAARFTLPSDVLDLSWKRRKLGIAMAARMPITATTIISSISVNPALRRPVWGSVNPALRRPVWGSVNPGSATAGAEHALLSAPRVPS